ncbi:MAG: hypothetical protein R3C09_12810 [Pirellulaceae bacterium]
MELTSLVAIAITLFPLLLYEASFELLWALAVGLILCASASDLFLERPNRFVRKLISLLLVVVALCMTWQWIRYDPRWGFLRFFVLLCTLLAVPRSYRIKSKKATALLSSIGVAVIVTVILCQFWETRSARYFVNRQTASGFADVLVTTDGKLALSGGSVACYLSSPFQRSRTGVFSEIQTLIDSVDRDEYKKPVTKFRIFCSSESIESLSFVDDTQEDDWRFLRHQGQLRSLDFNRLSLAIEHIAALRPLTALNQLAFFNCDLPDDLLTATRDAENLYVLQIVDCAASSLSGLSSNSEIRMLNLRGTGLTTNDLNEIAKLTLLNELDLRETRISDEELSGFAHQLIEHAATRRGQFLCKVGYNGKSTNGLVDLAKSGAVSKLQVHVDQHTKTLLADLAAKYPNIEMVPQEDGGTKP